MSEQEQRKLFIGSLKWELTEAELREAFELFGELEEVKIVTEKETGRSRGFGFIKFKDADAAKTAMEEMQDSDLKGRRIHVSYAVVKDPSRRRDTQPFNPPRSSSLPPSQPRDADTSQDDKRPHGRKLRRDRNRRSNGRDV